MVDTYIFWDGASTPSGWSLVSDSGSDFYHKFPRGAATYGGTGGSATHTAHIGSQTSSGISGTLNGAYGGSGAQCEGPTHSHPAGSATAGAGSSLPSYRTLKTIKYVGIPTSLPSGAITIFDNTCPSGHTQYSSQDDKYIYCDSTIGTTGGSVTHTHEMTGTLPNTSNCNTGGGFSPIRCPHNHTFTVTSGSGSYEPDWLSVILGKSGSEGAPPYSSILMFGANPGRPWNVVSKVGYPLYCRHIKPKASYGAYGSYRFHVHVANSGWSNYKGSTGAQNIPNNRYGSHRHTVEVTAGTGDGGDPPYLDVIYARRSLSYPPKRKINGHTIDAINRVNSHTKTEMDKFTYRVWRAKTGFGGTARGFAVGFALSDKFYLGTGYDLNAAVKDDFWVFDPSTNAWTQKADFGGASRNGAIGFAVGSYGYIGLGYNGSTYVKDFWRYDPSGNTWSQKTDYGGSASYCASSFALSSYGYAGLGDTATGPTNKWYRYDPSGNTWSQKANYGGSARDSASAFSIGSYAYVGCGWPASGVMVKDFWRYSENSWTQMTDLSGYARFGACGFSIGSDGYIVGGALRDVTGYDVRDAYKYDVTGNSWTGIADYGASTFSLKYLVGVGIGTEGYVATGIKGELGSFAFSNGNYEFGQRFMAIS